jgi:rSAM/selenodomain-associated transferase 1
MNPGRVAVAAMVKVPVAGEVKTRLCPPLRPEEAARLAWAFLGDRVEQLVGLPACDSLVAYTPPEGEPELRARLPGMRLVPQVGADLGMRMARLLADLLAEGRTGAVAVGTDTPSLPTAYLAEACRALERGEADVVLGPAEDGGYYLIGLAAPAPGLFADMSWGSASVYRTTLARAQAEGRRVAVLPTWFDVDRPGDLARLGRVAADRRAYRPPRTLALLAELGC